MMQTARRRLAAAASGLAAAALALTGAFAPTAVQAQGLFAQPKYAAIVEDANSGEVLYTLRADALRHPASLTKLMTLYLTFEALATGRLTMDSVITISPHAYSMMPSKISTHPGETLTVAEAIPTMTVHSANDVAVAMAERIGGSEPQFARLMTLRARELGMTETSFVNASGLPPDGEQISSARDLATLSRAIMRDYPQYYHFFGLKSYDFHGKLLMNHNHLVAKMPGVDGMKTGYTSLAGFNLVASGVRDGHRLITVVLGGPSVAARDENVEELLDAGFTVLRSRAFGQRLRLASIISSPEDMSGPVMRPPVEEGSADQPNLRVEMQPDLPATPTYATVKALAEPETTAAATPDCTPLRRGRRHRRHARAEACESAVAAVEPTKPTPVKAALDKALPAKVETAEAAPCPSRRGHRHAVCKAAEVKSAGVETADAADTAAAAIARKPSKLAKTDETGRYMIQVGAYKSHALAAGQVDKIGALVPGRGLVEEAGGNYRARFRGLSQTAAKAACRTLSAKGQACMVVAS